jgi:hypothetical protein
VVVAGNTTSGVAYDAPGAAGAATPATAVMVSVGAVGRVTALARSTDGVTPPTFSTAVLL